MTIPPGYPVDPLAGRPTQPDRPVCVRHADRPTGLRCARCDRPACPECLREASVGHHCVDCVNEGRRTVRRPVTVAGAELSTRPVVVPTLILLNVAVYLVTAVQAGSIVQPAVAPLFRQWALWPPIVAANNEWWRLLTSGFLHFSLAHVGLNMFTLWIIGRQVEIVLGRLRFVVVYFLSLFGGGVAVFLFGATGASVAGASGAVYGVMGGLAIAAFRLKINPRPVLGLIMLNVVLSVVLPGISLLGHLGGLVVGALATAGMVYPPARQRSAWQLGTVILLLAVLVVLVVSRDAQLAPVVCSNAPQQVCYGPHI